MTHTIFAIRHASETIAKSAAAGLLVTLELVCIAVYVAGVIVGGLVLGGAI